MKIPTMPHSFQWWYQAISSWDIPSELSHTYIYIPYLDLLNPLFLDCKFLLPALCRIYWQQKIVFGNPMDPVQAYTWLATTSLSPSLMERPEDTVPFTSHLSRTTEQHFTWGHATMEQESWQNIQQTSNLMLNHEQ